MRPRFAPPPRPQTGVHAPKPMQRGPPTGMPQNVQSAQPSHMPPPPQPVTQAPPPLAPPPMAGSGAGPRPMMRGPAGGGSQGDASADCNEVLPRLEALVRIYSEMETNAKAKSDALPRLEVLTEKLRQTQISAPAASFLKTIFVTLDE